MRFQAKNFGYGNTFKRPRETSAIAFGGSRCLASGQHIASLCPRSTAGLPAAEDSDSHSCSSGNIERQENRPENEPK